MSPSATVAAFDLDGTLAEGGSVFKWLRHVAGDAPALASAARLGAPLLLSALRSGPAADRAKESLFQALLRGRAEAAVREASRAFATEHFARHARVAVVERLDWHRAQGHDVVVVSASPELYVEVIAEILGASGAVATRLAVDARGNLTGSYLGRNCRGAEKRRRFEEWVSAHHDGEVESYAYGNSRGDRRLLDAVDHPVDAGRLGRLGALRRFPRLDG